MDCLGYLILMLAAPAGSDSTIADDSLPSAGGTSSEKGAGENHNRQDEDGAVRREVQPVFLSHGPLASSFELKL